MKIKIYLILVLSLLLASCQLSFAASEEKCAKVKDAESFWSYNMPTEAMNCLDGIISREPTNTKAHFLKGTYCLKTGNLACAEGRFQAKPVKEEYGSEIAKLYKVEADNQLGRGDENKNYLLYYAKSFEYEPEIQAITLQELFTIGRALAISGQYEEADSRLFAASYFDSGLANQSCDIFYNLGNQVKIDEALYFYDKARKYCTAHNEEIGQKLIQTAKGMAMIPGMEKQTEMYRENAIKYLGEKSVQKELPSSKVYQPGEYSFSLKAGEQTPHWITFPSGKISQWDLTSSDDKFQVIYEDGEVVEAWSATYLPKNKYTFKILAITDQPKIRMVVK